ncbi:MAG: hypothetical protein RL418_141, partial [Actinomycetota bacterium]
MTQAPRPTQRKVSPFSIAVGIIAVIATILLSAAGIYTDWLWFRQLGFEVVFFTQIAAQVLSFLAGWLVMSILVGIGLALSWRNRPIYLRLPEASPFQAYQQMIESVGKLVRWGLPLGIGVFGGLLVSRQWESIALWLTGGSFGVADGHFGLDVGFYVFELPFLTFAIGYLSGAVLLAGLVNGAVHLIYGGIRITGRDVKVSKPARVQLTSFVAIYLVLQGVSLWLDQYSTVNAAGELFTGVNYTGANAIIPGLQILALISAAVAVLFVITAVIGKWRISIIGTALMVVSSVVLGGLYPWLVQTFQVVPNERTLEGPFLQKNIDATRIAYGLDQVEVVEYDAKVVAEPGALRNDAKTTASIRIIDPALVSDA